jgi:chemosensory pili system protein ChpA (sensor histidine kinase/response regulator)
MGEQLDYTTLKWVKDEIQESLNQTHQALEAYIEDTSDTTQIRFCAAYLHQVFGTLQMVEIYGASLLAEEMEKVANALLNDQVANKEDAFDVLIRAIIQLPAYLEGLERGRADMPVVLTPLLNDLRASRGEPLLSESAFFSPDINTTPPEKHALPGKDYPDIQVYARKLRPIYQVSLLGWFRGDDIAGGLKKISAVLRELQNASNSEAAQRLWWVAGGIPEALLDEGLEISISTKLLMGQVDREIKRLIDQGEDTFAFEIPADLLKNCLYYVGCSTSTGPRVSALKQAFDLDALIPYSGAIDQAQDDLKGSTDDILQSVSSVIKEDLLHVKDQLDIFVRSPDRDITTLSPLAEILDRTADTLAMLNLADLRKVIKTQASNINEIVNDNVAPEDKVLMEIASALLYVESSLDTLQESRRTSSEEEAPDLAVHEESDQEGNVVLLPKSEQAQITNLVIKEAREVLADVKEGFNTFALEPERVDAIEEAPKKLVQIRGALSVMDYDKAASLLGSAVAYIRNVVLASRENPDTLKLDVLADAITSIEYYLEAIEEGRSQPESVLSVAEISVEQLGYPIGSEYETAPVGGDIESEPESEEVFASEGEVEFDFYEEPEQVAEEEIIRATDTELASTDEAIEQPVVETESAEVLSGEEPDAEYLEEDIDEEILEIFVEEADEVLGTMTDCLHAWRANNEDQKSLETLRRSYHTLKGSGRLAGAMVLGEFSWALENMLNRVLEGKLEPSPDMFKLLEQSEATVKKLLDYLKGNAEQRPPVKRLSDLANAFADGEQPTVGDVSTISSKPKPDLKLVDNTETNIEEPSSTPVENVEESAEFVPEDVSSLELESELETDEELGSADTLDMDSLVLEQDDNGLPELDELANIDETAEIASEAEESAYDPVLAQVFRKETIAHLAALNEFLNEYGEADSAPADEALHRALHTLHGSARMAGVDVIADLSEPMDRLIRVLHERQADLDVEGISLVKEFTAAIEEIAEKFDSEESINADYSEMLSKIARIQEHALTLPLPETEIDETQDFTPTAFGEDEEDEELIYIFLEETTDILASTDEIMQRWNTDNVDLGVVAELQRALHTIKGGARLAGLTPIGDLTHELESVLEEVVEGRQQMQQELPALVQSGLDWLVQSVESIKAGNPITPAVEILDEIRNLGSAAVEDVPFNDEDSLALSEDVTDDLSTIEVNEIEPSLFEDGSVNTDIVDDLSSGEPVSEIEQEETSPYKIQPEQDIKIFEEETGGSEMVNDDLLSEEPVEEIENQQEVSPYKIHLEPEISLFEGESDEEVSNEQPPTEIIELETGLVDEGETEVDFLNDDQSFGESVEEIEQQEENSPYMIQPEQQEDFGQESTLAEEFAEEVPEEAMEQLDNVSPFIVQPEAEPETTAEALPADYDPELLEVFIEEAEEIQEETERVLYDWSKEYENLDQVAQLQRSLHTLKGGARMANVTAIGDLAHAMESLLERIADGRTAPEKEHASLMQTCHDWLVRALEEAKRQQPIVPATELIGRIEAAIRGEQYSVSGLPQPEPQPEPTKSPKPEISHEPEVTAAVMEEPVTESVSETETELLDNVISFDKGKVEKVKEEKSATAGSDEQIRVRADLLNNLVNYSGEINIYNSRIAQQLGVSRFNLTELSQTVARLREQLRKFEIETEAQIIFRHETTTEEDDDFDPLELDRFSTMQQLSRSMVESLGDLTSIQNLLENQHGETDVLLLQQQRVTSDLQEGLMRTRMVAFSSVLPRLRRIVRQTCSEIGKQAELHVSGAEGEIDRTQLNRIVPALEHILRNAIDHGLEMPEDREKVGKPASGNVNIDFTHEGSEIVLIIKDDGKGINIDALRKKAIEKGLMKEDAELSDTEIMEFMLESGFSTAEKVTQISGRGVGMDVVNNEIKQLGGTLHINSKEGKGSTFRMHLPLTVLVNQALMVQSGEATYAIQLHNIEHVVRIGREELEQLIDSDDLIFEYAGNSYRYLNLDTVLHGAAAQLPEQRQRVPLMLIRSSDHRIALQVDNLIGRQEIVIKSVGPQLSSVGVLSGATILPNGDVALILDVGSLVRSALAQHHGVAEPLLPTEVAAEDEEQVTTVMIVDDSITVRKVTERLLKRYDYEIITAKDGVDALTVLLEQIPDVMLLDVEMPRMDGYELATTMRNDPRLKDIPIIMITSRTGEKHRQRALDIGVNMYMGKPYQEHDLIQNICTLTGTEQK